MSNTNTTTRTLTSILQHQHADNSDLDVDADDWKAQLRQKRLESDRYSEDSKDRKWLAKWTASIVSIWLFLVLIILCLNSLLFYLSDAVLITLLGTTTLNVLGLSFIVLRGHFQSHKHH